MSYEVENIYTSFIKMLLLVMVLQVGCYKKTYARQSTIAFNQLLNYSIKVNENHNFGSTLAGLKLKITLSIICRKLLEIFKGNEELDNLLPLLI
jgi:hypothetical protein